MRTEHNLQLANESIASFFFFSDHELQQPLTFLRVNAQQFQHRIDRFFMYCVSWFEIFLSLLGPDSKHLPMSVKFDLDVNQCHEANSNGEKNHGVGSRACL